MPIKREADLIRILKRSFEGIMPLVKVHGSSYSAGEPDLLGCYKGQMVQIEAKVDPNHVSPLQASKLKFWTKQGAYTCVVSYIKPKDQVWVFECKPDFVPCEKKTALNITNWIDEEAIDRLITFYDLPWVDGRKGRVDVTKFVERLKNERSRKSDY